MYLSFLSHIYEVRTCTLYKANSSINPLELRDEWYDVHIVTIANSKASMLSASGFPRPIQAALGSGSAVHVHC